MDGWMDGWKDGWMDGWKDGWMDGWMDGWIDKDDTYNFLCLGSSESYAAIAAPR
jgi:hypothetical protein